MSKRNALNLYVLIPLIALLLALISQYSGFDVWLESFFYDAKTHSWPFKSLFITSTVLHTWAKNLVVLFALANLLAIIMAFFIRSMASYRKPLVYLFIAAISGPLLVGWLKGVTHIYTPWNLVLFDGDSPHIRLFDSISIDARVGHAFPGGHSSGGFAYLALYFFMLAQNYKFRLYGLAIPLVMGVLFSIAQEMRGAHFISHDIISFAICWSLSLVWFRVFYPKYFTSASKSDKLETLAQQA